MECLFVLVLDGDLVKSPEHLGVSYLLAVLRKEGYRCRLAEVYPGGEEELLQQIRDLQPSFLGFTLTTVNFARIADLGRTIRARFGPLIHICCGGPVATCLGPSLFRSPGFDFLDSVFRGEAEEVLCRLVRSVSAGERIEDIPGVVTKRGGSPVVAQVRDLDGLPWPVRDQLAQRPNMPYFRILTSRGCTSKCAFCDAPNARRGCARGRSWRARNPKDVVDELEHVVKTYRKRTLDFIDSTFEDPGGAYGKMRIRHICELILQRRLEVFFNVNCQAFNWTENDTDLVRLMYRAGLEKVLIGVESGSDRILRLFDKRSTVADNDRAIRLFQRNGVYVAFGFIMFTPYTNWDDLEANAQFLVQHGMGHNLRRFTVRLELYPGAPIIGRLEDADLLEADYATTFNPYAYRYLDTRVEAASRAVNSVFGSEYVRTGRIVRDHPVWSFEIFDITLHTFMSRIKRACGSDSSLMERVNECEQEIAHEKGELTHFNLAIFRQVIDRCRSGEEIEEDLGGQVEARYTRSMNRIKDLQLKLGMFLRRRAGHIMA